VRRIASNLACLRSVNINSDLKASPTSLLLSSLALDLQ
jgi:hypothetical protein